MKAQVAKFILFSIGLLIASPTNFACTDFRLTAKDGTVLISRSMEFAIDMKANLRNSPRGKEVNTKAPNGGPGLSWKAKYGYLFIDAFEQDIVVDGMNEAGLSFEFLYLPGETQYPAVPPGKDAQSLPYYQFGEWVLGNFKTVDEIKKALADVYVYQAFFPGNVPGVSTMIFPLHASIYEANGKGIIIEFVAGKVNVYDSIGILTNSPTYGWQVANLRNYLNLSPYVPKSVTVNGISYSSTGQGSGSVGLPGDASPPSRFAKIAFLTTAAFPANNQSDVLNLGEHIINNVDIPTGLARSVDNGKESTDYTQWVVFKDLTHKIIYYRTYHDLTLRMIDLNRIDLSEKAQPMKMSLANPPYTIDMTAKFSNQPGNNTVAKVNAATKVNTETNAIVVPKIKMGPKTSYTIKFSTASKWGRAAMTNAPTKTVAPTVVVKTADKVKMAIKTNTKHADATTKVNATAVKKVSAEKKVTKASSKPLVEKLNAAANKN